MNFSSSLMSGMGISLGGLEIATDFLFANPEFYEPELTEIKTTISNKPKESIQKNVKTVKPKVNRETIINKFSIIKTKPVLVSDEVIENSSLVKDVDDFDFSFDITVDNNKSVKVTDIEETDAEALTVMEKLNASNDVDNKYEDIIEEEDAFDIEDIEDDNIDFENDTFDIEADDLDIEETENSEDDTYDIDSLDFDTDVSEQEDDNSADEFDIDSLDFEEDEDKLDGDESDSRVFDIDSLTLDEEDEDDLLVDDVKDIVSSDKIFNQQPSKNNAIDIEDEQDSDDELNIDINEDELGISEDEPDIEDELDIAIEDEIGLDIKQDNITKPKKNSEKSTINEVNNTYANKNPEYDAEIIALKNKIAAMEKQMQIGTSDKTIKDTSELKRKNNNFNEDDSLDDLVTGIKPGVKQVQSSKYDKYTVLNVEQLYSYVRQFMINNGLHKNTIDIAILNQKFGEANIKKLIQKSYLIKIGKGVTTGI